MAPTGMPQTIGGRVYVENENGEYEELGYVSDSEIEATDEPLWMMPVSESFSFTIETNNHRKYHGRPLRRGICNPKRWIKELFK